MHQVKAPAPFWARWLQVVTLAVMGFGLLLVLFPQLTRDGFSLLVYGNTASIAAFDPKAVEYISLVHAVLGAVMVGWGAALLLVVRGPFARGAMEGWHSVAVPVAVWFVPDTLFSLWSGFWQNAVLNLVFVLLFAIPLTASYKTFRAAPT